MRISCSHFPKQSKCGVEKLLDPPEEVSAEYDEPLRMELTAQASSGPSSVFADFSGSREDNPSVMDLKDKVMAATSFSSNERSALSLWIRSAVRSCRSRLDVEAAHRCRVFLPQTFATFLVDGDRSGFDGLRQDLVRVFPLSFIFCKNSPDALPAFKERNTNL